MLSRVSAWRRNRLSVWFRAGRLEVVFRQLEALVRSGAALPTAFVQLRQYAPDDAFSEAASRVAKRIAAGGTLGEALRDEPDLFEPAHVELISAGESSGTLDVILKALAEHLATTRKLRFRALLQGLWPAYLLSIALVLGPFVGLASGAAGSNTLVGAYFSSAVPGFVLAGLAVAAIIFGPVAVHVLRVESQWDRFVLQLPGIGGALKSLAASRALLTLGLAQGAGLDVARSLRASLAATGHVTYASRAEQAVQLVRSGGTLAAALQSVALFDRSVLGQLAIAEQTGTIDTTLKRLAPELMESTVRAVRVLIIVVVGLVAAFALLTIVRSLMGAIFGPIKAYYDLAGTGRLPGDSP